MIAPTVTNLTETPSNQMQQAERIWSSPAELTLVGSDCFTAVPAPKQVKLVLVSYKSLMKHQLLNSLDSASEGLNIDLSHITNRIRQFDVSSRFSPAIFSALSQLTEALCSGQVTDVLDVLQDFQITSDEDFLDGNFRIGSVLTEPWEKPFIKDVRQQKIKGVHEQKLVLNPIIATDTSEYSDSIRKALKLLKLVEPKLRKEFDEIVTRVKLFGGKGYFGLSSPAVFGAIFIRLPVKNHVAYFLEHLVHELSHLTLNATMAHDPILENPFEMNQAPLRPDSRPLFQILHATFVLSRNVSVSRKVVARFPELGFQSQLVHFEEKFFEGYSTLEKTARFTPMGRQLFQSMQPLIH